MAQRLFAEHALLADGWARHVLIEVDDAGFIAAVSPDSGAGDAQRLAGPALPGMPNLHSHAFQRAMAGLKRFEASDPERAAKVQPLFVSVDPARDTPEVLTEFTDAFHPRLIGMTGSKEQLDKIAKDYAAYYSVGEPNEAGGYLVDHTSITYLFGPDGEPIAILPTDAGPEAVAEELDKWVR